MEVKGTPIFFVGCGFSFSNKQACRQPATGQPARSYGEIADVGHACATKVSQKGPSRFVRRFAFGSWFPLPPLRVLDGTISGFWFSHPLHPHEGNCAIYFHGLGTLEKRAFFQLNLWVVCEGKQEKKPLF